MEKKKQVWKFDRDYVGGAPTDKYTYVPGIGMMEKRKNGLTDKSKFVAKRNQGPRKKKSQTNN